MNSYYFDYLVPIVFVLLHVASMRRTCFTNALSKSTTTTFYILRHGETDTNVAGIISGSSDKPYLTEAGKSQAEMVGYMALAQISEKAQTNQIDRIFVSPLTRARDTLAFFRDNAPPNMKLPQANDDVILNTMREIDFYSWTYQTKEVLKQRHPKEFEAFQKGDPDGLVVDGHFPLHEVWERAGDVWGEIRSELSSCSRKGDDNENNNNRNKASSSSSSNKHVLLVCHGTLGQALLGSAFGHNATAFRKNPFENCQMAEICWHDDEDLAKSWRWINTCDE